MVTAIRSTEMTIIRTMSAVLGLALRGHSGPSCHGASSAVHRGAGHCSAAHSKKRARSSSQTTRCSWPTTIHGRSGSCSVRVKPYSGTNKYSRTDRTARGCPRGGHRGLDPHTLALAWAVAGQRWRPLPCWGRGGFADSNPRPGQPRPRLGGRTRGQLPNRLWLVDWPLGVQCIWSPDATNVDVSIESRPRSGSIDGREMTVDTTPCVLVLFESTRSGVKAVREAAKLVGRAKGELTVVTVAPQECRRCSGPSAEPYNCAVRADAARGLQEARQVLGPDASRATFRVLVGQHEPASSKRQLAAPVALWVAEHAFDIVFLPRQRLRPGGHYAARKLRASPETEIRLVG